jgi:hypothetical protein
VEGARPFTSKRKTRKSANCWTEILNGSISLPTHQSEKIVHFASQTMLVDSRTDLEMCLVAVSEKPFCLRLSLTETKSVDGVFLETDELHPL